MPLLLAIWINAIVEFAPSPRDCLAIMKQSTRPYRNAACQNLYGRVITFLFDFFQYS